MVHHSCNIKALFFFSLQESQSNDFKHKKMTDFGIYIEC